MFLNSFHEKYDYMAWLVLYRSLDIGIDKFGIVPLKYNILVKKRKLYEKKKITQ